MSQDLIAVIDVGKTNARATVIAADTGEVIWSRTRVNRVTGCSPLLCLDVAGVYDWMISALSQAPNKRQIRAIVPVAHGAAAVLLDRSGAVVATPDYEDPAFETTSDSYRTLRDSFELTFSPHLPLGLNLGRQLHYVQQSHPELFEACDQILLYPQYWAWRLSGVLASEITSLGCHSDLWRPLERGFSQLAKSQGWDKLFPPLRSASDALGPILPAIAQATGLSRACRVLCGIHDSNASYLCVRAHYGQVERFALISSGTWTVVMAPGTDTRRLHEKRDMLANIDAFGSPVPTARFMGGREYEIICAGASHEPSAAQAASLIERGVMALPSFTEAGGPFAGRRGQILQANLLRDDERASLATLYCSLQTDLLLDLLGFEGPIVVDGPLAANSVFGGALGALRPGSQVLAGDNRSGPEQCARLLFGCDVRADFRPVPRLAADGLAGYKAQWRQRVEGMLAA